MPTPAAPRPPHLWTWAVFLLCAGLELAFLLHSGAFQSDLGGDPDEAAHAVTSLMMRDYLAGGWTQSPLTFAKAYYADFPKVALGHYPPGFYLLAGVWLLPLVSVKSLFVLQAVLSGVLAAVVFRMAARLVTLPAALAAALLVTVLPLSLKQSQFVLSDTLLTILCLLAAAAWTGFSSKPGLKRALGFGLLAAGAILTKGSAMGLALVPPVATALTRQWGPMRRPAWWLSAAPVAVLAGPWMLYSTRITSEGMAHQPLGDYAWQALVFYLESLPRLNGWILCALMLAGLVLMLRRALCRKEEAALLASLIGMLAGLAAVALLVPSGTSTRYLLPMQPGLVMAAVLAAESLCLGLGKGRWPVFTALVIGGFVLVADLPKKDVHGYAAAVARAGVPTRPEEAAHWLVAADPRGEGAVIAAAAFACPQRSPSILRVCRGSKELAASDWLGRDYQSPFETPAEILAQLEKLGISRVFVDLSLPVEKRPAHERMLLEALKSAPESWALEFEQEVRRPPQINGLLQVYQRPTGKK